MAEFLLRPARCLKTKLNPYTMIQILLIAVPSIVAIGLLIAIFFTVKIIRTCSKIVNNDGQSIR